MGPGSGLGLASMGDLGAWLADAGMSWSSSLGASLFVFGMAAVAEAGEDSSLGILFFYLCHSGCRKQGGSSRIWFRAPQILVFFPRLQ